MVILTLLKIDDERRGKGKMTIIFSASSKKEGGATNSS